jgi:Ca2+-binding RTX toxin-like protein
VPVRRLPHLLLALVVSLLAAAPATAGGVATLDGTVLRFAGDPLEPSNVTIMRLNGMLVLQENASRMTAGAGCVVSEDGYLATCPDAGVERIEVALADVGSDVRILADLPALLRGGAGDDVLIGGPAEDAIDGGGGQDVLGGGPGLDELRGGAGVDLATYADRVGSDGVLLERGSGVRIAVGRLNWSGGFDERDTIVDDVEQVQGGAGVDRFELRDGVRTEVACGAGRDRVIADPRDDIGIDCELGLVAPPRGGARQTVPTLAFPFTRSGDRGRTEVRVSPVLPLLGGAVSVRVACPLGVGLIDLAGPGCSGKVRFLRGSVLMGTQDVRVARGRAKTLRLGLTGSRDLARRPGGLAITVVGIPARGDVRRTLRFVVRG